MCDGGASGCGAALELAAAIGGAAYKRYRSRSRSVSMATGGGGIRQIGIATQSDRMRAGRKRKAPSRRARRRAINSMVASHETRVYTGGNVYTAAQASLTFNAATHYSLMFGLPAFPIGAFVDRNSTGRHYRVLSHNFTFLFSSSAPYSILLRYFYMVEKERIPGTTGFTIDPVDTATGPTLGDPGARYPGGWVTPDTRTTTTQGLGVVAASALQLPQGGALDRFRILDKRRFRVVRAGSIFLAGTDAADADDAQFTKNHTFLRIYNSHGRSGRRINLRVDPAPAGTDVSLAAVPIIQDTYQPILLLWACRADASTPLADGVFGAFYKRTISYVEDV